MRGGNESDRSIKMVDGATPLILINGHKVNSGINSIDPKEVEAVEVINNPSARYLFRVNAINEIGRAHV